MTHLKLIEIAGLPGMFCIIKLSIFSLISIMKGKIQIQNALNNILAVLVSCVASIFKLTSIM